LVDRPFSGAPASPNGILALSQRVVLPEECGGMRVQVPGEIRIPTRYSHEHLGTMIGANREAVTRAFGRLQDEGALQIRRRLIYVDDLEALQRAAGRLLLEEGAEESPS